MSELLNLKFSPVSCYFLPLGPNVFLTTLFSEDLIYVLSLMRETNFKTRNTQEEQIQFFILSSLLPGTGLGKRC